MMTDWLLDDAPLAPLPIYASPFAKSASGGGSDDDDSDDDDSDDDDDDDDSDDDDSDDDDDLADLSDDELRAELKKTRGELSKASGSSKVKRDRIKALRRELDEERRKPKAKAEKDDDKGGVETVDVEAIKAEAKRDALEAATVRIKRSEAKSAFVAKGAAPDVAADLLGFLKLDDIDVDDDGEIDAESLAEEIDRVTKKYPALFSRGRKRRESVAGGGDRGNDRPRTKTMTASEKQAALLTGGGRR